MEKIVTFVVRNPSSRLDGPAVLGFLRSRISAAKLPDRVLFRDVIPRTATHKVRLAQLHAEAVACFQN
jgi:acyl-CoA synthetase (AMP-forming)/AMP-acid ligase II